MLPVIYLTTNLRRVNRDLEMLNKLEKELSLKELQIKSLLTITQAINDNVSSEGLFNMYRSFLSWEMGIAHMILFIRDDESWEVAAKIKVEAIDEAEVIEQCQVYKRLHTVKEDDHVSIRIFDIIIPVFHKNQPIAYALIGGIKDREDIYNRIQFITTITNIIAVAIENKRLFRQQIKQERLNKEMELAKEFQQMLIPEKIPPSDKYAVDIYYRPHSNVGGDYVDFIKYNKDRFAVVIADISGKGVAAALLMSNFQAMLHGLVQQYRDLETFVFALNQAVYRITKSDKFITFFIAEFDIAKRSMTYINAGHFPPVLYNGGEITELKTGSTVIGAFDKLPFIQEEKIALKSDALLFCFTDGLADLQDDDGNYFEETQINKYVLDNKELDVDAFNEKLIQTLDDYRGEREYVDDIAILTTKIF